MSSRSSCFVSHCLFALGLNNQICPVNEDCVYFTFFSSHIEGEKVSLSFRFGLYNRILSKMLSTELLYSFWSSFYPALRVRKNKNALGMSLIINRTLKWSKKAKWLLLLPLPTRRRAKLVNQFSYVDMTTFQKPTHLPEYVSKLFILTNCMAISLMGSNY